MNDSSSLSSERSGAPSEPATLKRALTLPLLVFYGVGTIVGGGFYALMGKVAGEAGLFAPIAWMAAALVALFSGLSYGALATRFPVSAGEAEYAQRAFGRRWLSSAIGWLVIFTGLVSAAALSRAVVGFLGEFWVLPMTPALFIVVGLMGAVAAWGISESVWVSVVITIIEVGGLFLVVTLRGEVLADLPARLGELMPAMEADAWRGIGLGSFLAFYAFIGFEDMVNVVEEVRNPRVTMPRAILVALAITTALYLLVSTVAVLAMPPEELAASDNPLLSLVASQGPVVTLSMALISILAGVNGALVQIIMSARVAYGLSERQGAPRWLGSIHRRTRTPLVATGIFSLLIFGLATWFPLAALAKATSAIVLVVFISVNLSLLWVRVAEVRSPAGGRLGPKDLIPLVGALACLAFLALQGRALLG